MKAADSSSHASAAANPKEERKLTRKNIDRILQDRLASIESVGRSIKGKTGLALLEAIKRKKTGAGPYPDVTLFEAANRIMTDLVILNGVKCLLESKVFAFGSYKVELGHEDHNGFDIRAEARDCTLVGEAFNVAPSFFQVKKTAMLRKLRDKGKDANYRLIMVNHDAVPVGYKPKGKPGEAYVFVNITTCTAEIVLPDVH